MQRSDNLQRFLTAQQNTFDNACEELYLGRKTTHWMWFIFPQLAGLGSSETARYYGIRDLREAASYLQHEVLGMRLIRISGIVLNVKNKTAHEIFGSPDDLKLRSCVTLFSLIPGADPVFQQVLNRYYSGMGDEKTLNWPGLADKN